MLVLLYKGEKGKKLINSLNKDVKNISPENNLLRYASEVENWVLSSTSKTKQN